MQAVLIVIIAGVLGGTPIGAVLAGLTMTQWVTLGLGVATELEPEVAKLLGEQHESLGLLVEQIGKGVAADVAAKAATEWLAANGDAAIRMQPGAAGQ